MALSPNELVATNGSSNECSCSLTNTHGCNLSLASGTLNATMTQNLSATGSPQFTNFTPTGQLNATATTDSSSTTTGAIITAGGAGVAKNATVGGQINSTNTTDSTSTTTGAIITAGGMGIAKNISCGGGINFGNGTLSSYGAPQSWTPILSIGGSTTGITYSNQSGTAVNLGNVAMCTFGMNLTSKGTNMYGIVTISLPFTAANTVQPYINVGAWGLVGLDTGFTQLSLKPLTSTTASFTLSNPSGGGNVDMQAYHLTNSSGIWGNIWYLI